MALRLPRSTPIPCKRLHDRLDGLLEAEAERLLELLGRRAHVVGGRSRTKLDTGLELGSRALADFAHSRVEARDVIEPGLGRGPLEDRENGATEVANA